MAVADSPWMLDAKRSLCTGPLKLIQGRLVLRHVQNEGRKKVQCNRREL